MLDQRLKIGKILEQLQDVLGSFKFTIHIVLIEGWNIIIQAIDVRGKFAHFYYFKTRFKDRQDLNLHKLKTNFKN